MKNRPYFQTNLPVSLTPPPPVKMNLLRLCEPVSTSTELGRGGALRASPPANCYSLFFKFDQIFLSAPFSKISASTFFMGRHSPCPSPDGVGPVLPLSNTQVDSHKPSTSMTTLHALSNSRSDLCDGTVVILPRCCNAGMWSGAVKETSKLTSGLWWIACLCCRIDTNRALLQH